MSIKWVYGCRGIQGCALKGEEKQFEVNVEEG
jgi:hypothetical protein